ncbi:putative ABC transport system ATP-binding protein [Oikeobacillus pervagus]|uniref:Putative hemin import ATP-binding protein HrtA n=1 Tax=Oikeobacillus pervagus TaxID=1325931 RepID=A0AAJ1T3U7_9BACI|nr:ABC transporter ATP-binding protein [Oikeobacillus pervagus]MDQ0216747.1 putative ABC transport system ATP-binding protein [Oikeobacillus pervagus]
MTPIVLKDVKKNFKDGDKTIEILKGINFEANKGELVAVVGPSGSGKSTFLSIAGALLSPDEGEVLIDGKNIVPFRQTKKADIRLHEIGYIFQSSNLVPYLKVIDQLKYVAKVAGKTGESVDEQAKKLLTSVGLGHRIHHYPYQLSGGERQRVAIARAFMNNPSIILADEPTASLDSSRSWEIIELIAKEVKAHQKAAILVTHDESVLPLCDRIVSMKDGKLVASSQ